MLVTKVIMKCACACAFVRVSLLYKYTHIHHPVTGSLRYPFIDVFREEENKTTLVNDACKRKNRYCNDNIN